MSSIHPNGYKTQKNIIASPVNMRTT